jgi:hypothetical protein
MADMKIDLTIPLTSTKLAQTFHKDKRYKVIAGKGRSNEKVYLGCQCELSPKNINFKCAEGGVINMKVEPAEKSDTYILTDAADFEIYELPSAGTATRTSRMDQMEMGGRRRKSRKSKKSKRSKKSRKSRK